MTTRAVFREQLVALFSIEELETLCHDLEVDPETIPGREKGKAYFADQLIRYFETRERIPELQSALQRARPKANWKVDLSISDSSSPELPTRMKGLPMWVWLGGAGVIAVLLIGLVIANLPKPSAPLPPTPTLAPTSAPTAAPTAVPSSVPTSVPKAMPRNGYNIFVADIGQMDAGKALTLTEGETLSADFVGTLQRELDDPTVLPSEARADFPPVVWGSAEARSNGWIVPPIANDADAERVAKQLNAQLVIYGNFEMSGTSKLTFGMYVPTAINVADELMGRYPLGAPLDVALPITPEAAKGVQLDLNGRSRLLSRWALGLAYDIYGRKEQALQMFLSAAEKAKQINVGLDVTNFLVGREYLFLRKTEDAEAAHKAALEFNQDYVRAHIGLGDVYFQYAAQMTPTLALETAAYDRALVEYTEAEKKAGLQPDTRSLLPLSRLGLGLTKVLQAAALDSVRRTPEAIPLFTEGIRLIEPALTEMGQRPEGQRRTLALGYFWLAQAYRGLARSNSTGDRATQLDQFKRAETAFDQCVQLDFAVDAFQHTEITAACQRNKTRMLNADVP